MLGGGRAVPADKPRKPRQSRGGRLERKEAPRGSGAGDGVPTPAVSVAGTQQPGDQLRLSAPSKYRSITRVMGKTRRGARDESDETKLKKAMLAERARMGALYSRLAGTRVAVPPCHHEAPPLGADPTLEPGGAHYGKLGSVRLKKYVEHVAERTQAALDQARADGDAHSLLKRGHPKKKATLKDLAPLRLGDLRVPSALKDPAHRAGEDRLPHWVTFAHPSPHKVTRSHAGGLLDDRAPPSRHSAVQASAALAVGADAQKVPHSPPGLPQQAPRRTAAGRVTALPSVEHTAWDPLPLGKGAAVSAPPPRPTQPTQPHALESPKGMGLGVVPATEPASPRRVRFAQPPGVSLPQALYGSLRNSVARSPVKPGSLSGPPPAEFMSPSQQDAGEAARLAREAEAAAAAAAAAMATAAHPPPASRLVPAARVEPTTPSRVPMAHYSLPPTAPLSATSRGPPLDRVCALEELRSGTPGRKQSSLRRSLNGPTDTLSLQDMVTARAHERARPSPLKELRASLAKSQARARAAAGPVTAWKLDEDIDIADVARQLDELEQFAQLLEDEQGALFDELAGLHDAERVAWEALAAREFAARDDRKAALEEILQLVDATGVSAQRPGLMHSLDQLLRSLHESRTPVYTSITPLLAQAEVTGELAALPPRDRIAFLEQRQRELEDTLAELNRPW